ncbi:sulfite exporter TauE/SafE family protein [Streptomyces sp. NPDC048385]|uniref:sulfite exporter TauE/SafE family protein n=1 Tax=unclassified Streptomyces TaxID=2593676 RepID=UPI0034349322
MASPSGQARPREPRGARRRSASHGAGRQRSPSRGESSPGCWPTAAAFSTPLYLLVLRLPVKRALATSLLVSAALAIPGTVAHWAVGHIDWRVVAAHTVLAVPASYLGARLALRTRADRLTRVYGAFLVLLAGALLLFRR